MSEQQQTELRGPRPEPIRFFGTTWVEHDGGYPLRRAGLAVGSLAAAVAGALVLRFAYQGLAIAKVGSLINLMVIVAVSLCTALAFRRTWEDFGRRRPAAADPGAERSMQSLVLIGFVGVLLAYFLRSLREAPGEKLHREEYREALARQERRRSARTGNPAAKRKRKHR
ncbi:hypothetical protein ACIHFE_29640 [Streptomyces sp. NPDC052396]|uniref:hypothetical protein n=1 Tax=Streptomyces sp. NPDC052396 TaxID=3365689 RepID=UPI0037D52B9F